MMDQVAVPAMMFPGLEKQREVATDVVTLAQRYGLLTGSASERITIAPADAMRADVLNVAPGAPLLNFDRVVFELNGLPLEWRLGYCHLTSGYTSFTPIINAPEVAILGVTRSAMKAVWDGSQFVPRLMVPLSLSYDHRVIDGALAARFTTYLVSVLSDLRRGLL